MCFLYAPDEFLAFFKDPIGTKTNVVSKDTADPVLILDFIEQKYLGE